jgi:hypothetical protein
VHGVGCGCDIDVYRVLCASGVCVRVLLECGCVCEVRAGAHTQMTARVRVCTYVGGRVWVGDSRQRLCRQACVAAEARSAGAGTQVRFGARLCVCVRVAHTHTMPTNMYVCAPHTHARMRMREHPRPHAPVHTSLARAARACTHTQAHVHTHTNTPHSTPHTPTHMHTHCTHAHTHTYNTLGRWEAPARSVCGPWPLLCVHKALLAEGPA